jgi:hypothetical protein
MSARVFRDVALGVAVTLAMAVLLTLLWGAGSAASIEADNLDVCPSGCPYTTIQEAIYAAEDGDTIRVAAGTYTGTMSCTYWGGGTFTNTLCITEDITLLGGYNPVDFSMRDPDQYTTTVKWEGEPGHIVMHLVNGTSATIDGFEITGATGAPIGAIYIRDSAPTIRHNRIAGNHTAGHGGGIYVTTNSTPTIESNVILSNTADESGGGIAVRYGATAVISGNLIVYNEAITNGGGIYVTEGSVVTLTNNQILSNTVANNGGGGFLAENGSSFVMSGNTFQGNFAGCCGGGMAAWWNTTGTITRNTFRGNTARDWSGGGVLLVAGSFDVMSNTITENHADAYLGGGVAVAGEDGYATLVRNIVMSNTASAGGGGISIDWGPTAVVKSNLILSNTAHAGTGSGLRIASAEVLVDGNLIADNSTDLDWGQGAIGVTADGQSRAVTITNNLIVDNADRGLIAYSDEVVVVNNTIAANTQEGVVLSGPWVMEFLRNNIIASNEWCGIVADAGAEYAIIDYNDVWNNGGGDGNYCDYGSGTVPPAPGPGSISADPQFVDAAAGDYHLAWGSPAVNAGTNAGAPTYDKDGVPRPQMGRVDMGAYELLTPHIVYLPITLREY